MLQPSRYYVDFVLKTGWVSRCLEGNFPDLLQPEPRQPVQKSTFPNLIFIMHAPLQRIRNADFGTYLQRRVTDEAISLHPEKDSNPKHCKFLLSKVSD